MSCHGCAARFGLFTKENGCPVCGFAFCSSCLKFICRVPSLNGAQRKVCKKCFTAISSNEEAKVEAIAPPDSFLKRLEALENPSRPPITMYRQDKRSMQLKQGLSEKDLELYNRLEKLRAERRLINTGRAISVEEIERRLAVLRGQDPDIMTKKPSYTAPDTRSQQQQSDDLLNQASEEIKLKSRIPRPEDEIAERLNRLRGTSSTSLDNSNRTSDEKPNPKESSANPSLDEIAELLMKSDFDTAKKKLLSGEKGDPSNTQDDHESDNSSDEETAITKIVSKAEALAKLEQEREEMDLDDDEDNNDLKQEELPWCCICNEDASRRCIDCDGDLYCDYCFKEGHHDIEMRKHKTVRYRCPKT